MSKLGRLKDFDAVICEVAVTAIIVALAAKIIIWVVNS